MPTNQESERRERPKAVIEKIGTFVFKNGNIEPYGLVLNMSTEIGADKGAIGFSSSDLGVYGGYTILDLINIWHDAEVRAAILGVLEEIGSWEIKPHKKLYQVHNTGEYFKPGFDEIRKRYEEGKE